MPRPIHHEDLVARALDALSGNARTRVDAALAADPELRRQFEQIAGHLLQYDHLPPAPPAPPFARIAAALEADTYAADAGPDLAILKLQEARPAHQRLMRRRLGVLAAAAVLLVGLLVLRPWEPAPAAELTLIPGRGLTLLRDGVALPAPALAARRVAAGDVLACAQPAEARLGDRVRLVLDAGSRLRLDGNDAVTLEAGRGWFEVRPQGHLPAAERRGFAVFTEHGPVRVMGTVFDVDVRRGRLEVGVAQGRVSAAGAEIRAGQRLIEGTPQAHPWPAGEWFRRARLRVEAVRPGPQAPDAPLALRLVFENPAPVPVTLRGPASARTPIWISFEDAGGRVLRELKATRVTAGAGLLTPGTRLELQPGARRVITIEIPVPFGSPGTYFCRALYRPEGQPGVLSDATPIQVRGR